MFGQPELPTSPVEVYLDVEGDISAERVYLIGMLINDRGSEERHSFWAGTKEQETLIFRQFMEVLGQYEDFPPVHLWGVREDLSETDATTGQDQETRGPGDCPDNQCPWHYLFPHLLPFRFKRPQGDRLTVVEAMRAVNPNIKKGCSRPGRSGFRWACLCHHYSGKTKGRKSPPPPLGLQRMFADFHNL